nr:hypothetical protein GCM10020093_071070 [Planobispora longispora]
MLHSHPGTTLEPPADPSGRASGPAGPGRAVRRRHLVLWLTAVAIALAVLAGHDVHDRLTFGGATVSGAESERAERLLATGFGTGVPHLVLIARGPGPVDRADAVAAGKSVAARLARDPAVTRVTSYWDIRSPTLRSGDGRAALILARLRGDDRERTGAAARLAPALAGAHGPLTVLVTGRARSRPRRGAGASGISIRWSSSPSR